jgi:ferredoxin-nitrite reductase
VTAAIDALGLATSVSPLRAGLVACTGATGCRFAAAHTKESADEIAAWCDANVAMDTPVNVHLTGCHHSCAQHYIGDIGLIGARVPINDDGETVEGFNVLIGGGYGPEATIARELFTNVKAEDAPRTVAHILNVYLQQRSSKEESFLGFARRVDIEAFRTVARLEAAE